MAENNVMLRAQAVAALYERTRVELAIGILSAAAIAGLGLKVYGIPFAPYWVAAVVLVYAGRLLVANAHSRSSTAGENPSRWLLLFQFGMLLTGIAWGLAGAVIAPLESANHFLVAGFWFGCMALIVTAIYSGLFSASLLFTLPALAPAIFVLLKQSVPLNTTVAIFFCVFLAVLLLSAFLMRARLLPLLNLPRENEQLKQELKVAKEEATKFSVGLKTNAGKQEKTEQELQRVTQELASLQGETRSLTETLEQVAPTCPVTGLITRRYFDESLDSEWQRVLREEKPLSLVVLAIDDYDAYLETYGQQAADICLKEVGQLTKTFARRAGDVVARYGDSSFALLLPGADTRRANALAEEVRQAIQDLEITHKGSSVDDSVTVHVGVATMIPNPKTDPSELLERVENTVFEANVQGGNRVMCHRAMDKFRLESWNWGIDGALTEESLAQKLLAWGYTSKRGGYAADTRLPDQNYREEIVQAVYSGRLRIIVDGQSMSLKQGDCLFIPPGTTCSYEVIGSDPVVYFGATRTK